MKLSKYNFFFSFDDNRSIAYNSLTNSLALIEKSKLDEYYAFCETKASLSFSCNRI